jgi:hypothetical protein
MTTMEACEMTRSLGRENLTGRTVLLAGRPRGSARRLVAASLAAWGGAVGLARVVHLLRAGAWSLVAGLVWALSGSRAL